MKLLSHALALTSMVVACRGAEQAPQAQHLPVAHPIEREVVEWDEYTARIQSPHSVDVRARVSGVVDSVAFRDGQMVEKGTLLFVIDPRPFRAEFDRARGELAQQESRLTLARNEAARAERLVARKAISQEEFEARTSALRNTEAMVQSARAALESARLNLEFTEVRSPIRGRAGRDLVHAGNLVNGGGDQSTLLTTVVSLDPMHAYFEVDERAYLRYTELARKGERPSSREFKNLVLMQLADETGYPHRGYMDFVDNALDATTGTLQGRAVFPNPELKLSPGLFGRIRLVGSGRYRAILLPDSAIGTDQSERFVFVLDAEKRVERRAVTMGPSIDGFRVIRAGVKADDWVVVSGIQGARSGATVVPDETKIEAPENFASLDLLDAAPAPAATPAAR
ncbi:efflux RND transporter periplasmic adaptor subunit [Myxococcota bacterium]|nr:efflux RND transporter periplasmic adaptor subunit [Myxococcota bacterium]